MSRWFRIYDEALDDPKVQKLPAEDFRGWFNLLCLASRHDGKIPPVSDVAFALRRSLDDAQTLLQRLRDGGLIDSLSGGPNGCHDAPHAWAKRQYKSDTSTERVKRFRQRSATVTETPPETDTEAETDIIEPKGSSPIKPSDDPDALSINDMVEAWNANIAQRYGLPRCSRLSPSRTAQIRARLRDASFEEIDDAFKAFGRSKFLRGEPSRDGRVFRPDIGWLMNATNFAKVIEGKYDD